MKPVRTLIFCYDDYRAFSDDVKKNVEGLHRSQVISFLTTEDLLRRIEKEKGRRTCKIIIIGLHESIEHFEMVESLCNQIKMTDPCTGIVLLCPNEMIDDIKKIIRFNIEAYIPKNANYILRVTNTVRKLISEHRIAILKRRRNFTFYCLLVVVLMTLLSLVFAFFFTK